VKGVDFLFGGFFFFSGEKEAKTHREGGKGPALSPLPDPPLSLEVSFVHGFVLIVGLRGSRIGSSFQQG
jgi:hypothetical protein